MLFQMQALMNIGILESYGVKKILTCDPHAYNTFMNEYPDLGGKYEVTHHTQFLRDRIEDGSLKIPEGSLGGRTITYHDPVTSAGPTGNTMLPGRSWIPWQPPGQK